jgi:hypothetical protein
MRAQIQAVAPVVRGDGFAGLIDAMFQQVYGALDLSEVDRVSGLRRADRDVVLGMWSPLLELDPQSLEALVKEISTFPLGTKYLSLHGLNPGPDYAAWLGSLIPGAVLETWDDVPTHYPHLAHPERFVARVRQFTSGAS